jgi:hypothetical protein
MGREQITAGRRDFSWRGQRDKRQRRVAGGGKL